MPKQVKSKEELESLTSTGESAENAVAGQFLFSLLLNLVLSGTLSQLWNIFNTMQLLTALPLFAINTPGNIIELNRRFAEVSNFKIVEKEQLYDWVVVPVFGTTTSKEKLAEDGVISGPKADEAGDAEAPEVSAESKEDAEALFSEEEEEAETSYLDSTMAGTTLIMSILLILLVLILFGLLIVCLIAFRNCVNRRCCNICKTVVRKIEAKLLFNSVLRACLESYFLVALASMYGLVHGKFDSSEGIVTFVVGLLALTYLILFPVLSHRYLLKKQEVLGGETAREKYGALFQNVDYMRAGSLRFTLWFCARRLAFAFAVVILAHGGVVLQILAADLAVMCMLCFYTSLPMQNGLNNFVQIFNEIVVAFCVVSLVLFTNFIISPVERYDYGYQMLYVVATAIAINVAVLIASIIYGVYKSIRNYYRKRAWKKEMAALKVKRANDLKRKAAIREHRKATVLQDLAKIIEEDPSEGSSDSDRESVRRRPSKIPLVPQRPAGVSRTER